MVPKFLNTIDGRQAAGVEWFDSYNPATGEVIGHVAQSTEAQLAQAVAAARAAQPAWEALPDEARRRAMADVAQILQDNAEYLADWVTREQGKPLGGLGPAEIPGARYELAGCVAWTQAPAAMPLHDETVFEDDSRRDVMQRKPYGVIAAIAPWNWPLLIAIWQIIPALRTGNTVVLKPSEYTSIASLEMIRLIAAALPPGVINTVAGAGATGAALIAQPGIDKILFTGSGRTGSLIAGTAAQMLRPTTMELGGNDAAIVLDDADPARIATGLFWGAFLNMGQTCACIKRLYVPDSLHDAVVAQLKQLAASMPMGNGLEPGVAIGPIQNRPQHQRIIRLVEQARAQGAVVECGGAPADGPGNFYPVTLVTGIADGAALVDEEQFGPVLPIIRYTDLDAAIASANRLDLGLGASVWSSDPDRAASVADRLQAGTVWINQHGAVHPAVPFGGIKGSGWGVEFGLEGLKGVTRPKVISLAKA